MFCKNCGNEMSNGDNFCSRCGKRNVEENKGKRNVFPIIIGVIAIIVLLSSCIVYYSNTNKAAEHSLEQLSSAIYSGDYELAEQYADFNSITENFYTDYFEALQKKDKKELKELNKFFKDDEKTDKLVRDEYEYVLREDNKKKNLTIMRHLVKVAIKSNKSTPELNSAPEKYSWIYGNSEDKNIQYMIYLSQQFTPKIKSINIDNEKGIANIEFKAKKANFGIQDVNVKLEIKKINEDKWKVIRIINVDELVDKYHTATSFVVECEKDHVERLKRAGVIKE